MLLDRRFAKFRKLQKKRVTKNFECFSTRSKTIFSLAFRHGFQFFLKHLKIINFFLQKRISKHRHMSKKEKYKRLNSNDDYTRLFIQTHDFMRKNSKSTFTYLTRRERKCVTSHLTRRNRNTSNRYYFVPHQFLPFTKKSLGTRMGKGKGSVKFWFFVVNPGVDFVKFINWPGRDILRFYSTLRTIIPGHPFLKTSYFHSWKQIPYSIGHRALLKLHAGEFF